jgi:hypothetical protein
MGHAFIVNERFFIKLSSTLWKTDVTYVGIEDRSASFAEETVTVVAYSARLNSPTLRAGFLWILRFRFLRFGSLAYRDIYRSLL